MLESTRRKIERVKALFNELHVVGVKVKGRLVRMRYDDAIQEVSIQCFYSPSTVEAILKGKYLSYGKERETDPKTPEGGCKEGD